MPADAVIFDMDGLLLDTEAVCFDGFVEARRAFSLSDSPEVFLRVVGLRGSEAETIIRDSLGIHVGYEAFIKEWDKKIGARLGHGIPLKQGATQLVQILASKGFLMAVATSTQTHQAQSQLEKVGLLPYLNVVVGGDQVEKGKPDPEIYHKAAKHMGLKAPDCIIFEDSEPGATAALASGATTVQVPDLIQPSADFAKRGHVIASTLLEGALKIGLIQNSDF